MSEPVIVVGAGISGLACADRLRRLGVETVVLESGPRVGGVIQSQWIDGYLVESGPTSLLPTAHTFQVLDEVGLSGELLEADPKAARYIVTGGVLKKVPFGPLTARGIARGLAEPLIRSKSHEDESVAQFFRRRFGSQIHDRLVAPFVGGIYAGDSERLSIAATFPRLVEVERDHGSVVAGMLRGSKSKTGHGGRRSVISSFAGGMETLPRRLAAGLNIQLKSTGVRIGKTIQAAATVVAVPAYEAAGVVEPVDGELARLLRMVHYEPVVVAATSLSGDSAAAAPDGFGFLAPPIEGMSVLGTVFSSRLFDGRAPEGRQLLTSFVGGALKPEAFDWPDARVWDVVCSELKRVLKVPLQPEPVALFRRRLAIPQYTVGHLRWRHALEAGLERRPGLFIAGNYLDGVSVPACIEQADKLAHRVAEYIRSGK